MNIRERLALIIGCEDEFESYYEKADAILALEVPVWCDFYGKKCMNGYCSVSAKPDACHHKSSISIGKLISNE